MSATATESETSPLHDYLVLGETLFVTGAVLAFVSDVVLTFRSLVALNWIGLTLGMAFIVGTLYFVNWVYTGKKEARTPAAIWSGVQIAIAILGAYLLMNLEYRWENRLYGAGRQLPQLLSVQSWAWGLFKAAAYGGFLYLITQRGPALFFLRHKGGESVEVPSPTVPPEDIHPTGNVIALTAEQSDNANTLASTLQCASIALMTAGFFQAVVGGQNIAVSPQQGWLKLVKGIVLLVLGLFAMVPITSLRNIKDRGSDTAYVSEALSKLGGLIAKQVLLTIVLLAVAVAGLFVLFVKGS